MIPNYLVNDLVRVQREDLTRELEQARLVRAARMSNPGLAERARLYIGRILIQAGQRLNEQYTLPRHTHVDSSARFAA